MREIERGRPAGDEGAEQEPSSETSMESLLQEQASFRQRLDSRAVVWVKVVQVQGGSVLVDIGEKQEGAVPAADFAPDSPPAPGARVPVILLGHGRDDRQAALSHKKARLQLGWEQAVKAFEEKSRVRGTVVSAVKGGFMAEVLGVPAFLPASLADLRPVRNPEAMLHTGVRCYIVEINRDKKQLVLSRKAVLEEEGKKRRDKLLSSIKPGEVRIARVTHVAGAGVFADLGGLEGFIPAPELAWQNPEKARKAAAHGQKLRVKILKIETQTGKVTLGVKQLTPNPADLLKKKYPAKAIVKGSVAEVRPDGVRIQVSEDVFAFCPLEELPAEGPPPDRAGPERGAGRGAETRRVVWPAVGDKVGAVVLGIRSSTFEVLASVRRFDDMQDRKRVAKYLKAAPPLTLGQILTSDGD